MSDNVSHANDWGTLTNRHGQKFPQRMFVNQPSRHQQFHEYHGTRVLAVHEYDDTYRVYFLSGPTISMQMFRSALSLGWPDHG